MTVEKGVRLSHSPSARAMENVEKAVRLSHVYHSFFYCDEGQESVEKDRETFPLFLRPLPILFSWRLSALRDRYIRS